MPPIKRLCVQVAAQHTAACEALDAFMAQCGGQDREHATLCLAVRYFYEAFRNKVHAYCTAWMQMAAFLTRANRAALRTLVERLHGGGTGRAWPAWRADVLVDFDAQVAQEMQDLITYMAAFTEKLVGESEIIDEEASDNNTEYANDEDAEENTGEAGDEDEDMEEAGADAVIVPALDDENMTIADSARWQIWKDVMQELVVAGFRGTSLNPVRWSPPACNHGAMAAALAPTIDIPTLDLPAAVAPAPLRKPRTLSEYCCA